MLSTAVVIGPLLRVKNRTVWFLNAVLHRKEANGMAHIADPDQTAASLGAV